MRFFAEQPLHTFIVRLDVTQSNASAIDRAWDGAIVFAISATEAPIRELERFTAPS